MQQNASIKLIFSEAEMYSPVSVIAAKIYMKETKQTDTTLLANHLGIITVILCKNPLQFASSDRKHSNNVGALSSNQ